MGGILFGGHQLLRLTLAVEPVKSNLLPLKYQSEHLRFSP